MLTLDELKILGDAGLIDKTIVLEYPVSTALKGILKYNGCELDGNGNITAIPDIQILYSKLYNNGFVELYNFVGSPTESDYQEELTSKINSFIEEFVENFNDNSFYKSDYNSIPTNPLVNKFELLLFCYNNSVFKYDRYGTGKIERILEVNGTINFMDHGHGFDVSSNTGLFHLFGGNFTEVTKLSDNSQVTVNNVFMFDVNTSNINPLVGSTTFTDPINYVSVQNKLIVYINKTSDYEIYTWDGTDWNLMVNESNKQIFSVINNGSTLIHTTQLNSDSGLLIYNETDFQPFTIPEVVSGDNHLINDHQNINSIIPVTDYSNRFIINFNNSIASYGLTNYSSTNNNIITIDINNSLLTAVTVETKIVTTTENIIFASYSENCVYFTNPSSTIVDYGNGIYLNENFFDNGNGIDEVNPKYLIKNNNFKFLSKTLITNMSNNVEISDYDNYYRHTYVDNGNTLYSGAFYENRKPLKINVIRELSEILSEKKGSNNYTIPYADIISRWIVNDNWNE